MATVFEIPTSPRPQTFAIALGGVQYRLTFKWNVTVQTWVLDIADANSVPIVSGIPLIPGIDLLAQYAYLNFGGKMFATLDTNPSLPPPFASLGTIGHLYWVAP